MTTPMKNSLATLGRRLALTVLVAVVATVLGAGTAAAANGDASWTVRTDANDFGDDRTSFSYNVNPGGTVEDALVVANHGKEALTLGVYAADGYTTDSGDFDLVTQGQKSVGVGAWVTAEKASVTVQPGKTAELPFTVSIPGNATPGDHAGGIITSLVQADAEQTINVDRRLGIRIKLRVGGDLKPGLAIEDLQVNYDGTGNPVGKGSATLTYTIHNTGNAMLSGRPAASVAGPFGWLRAEASESSAAPQALLPGESWKVTERVADVAPAVRLAATATLTPLITDASGSTTSLKPVEAKAGGWAVSWTLLLLVVLLFAALVVVPLVLRRNRKQRVLREDARVQEAVEQALRAKESAR